jgi:nucleotide-binding universal stress UspA family protein
LKIQRILVPVDFSELSEGATLVLAHVYSPEVFKYTGGEGGYYVAQVMPTHDEAVADAKRLIGLLSGKIANGLQTESVVLEGDPAREIATYAEKNRIDLIVLPTRGYGPFRRFVLGSVTAKVLDDCGCPILTTTHGIDAPVKEPRPYRRVACAIDLGPHSESIVRWGADFASTVSASLHVILAAPPVTVAGRDLGVSIRDMILSAANEEILKLLDRAGASAEIHVNAGEVSEYVPMAASVIQADVLVIGRTSKEGFLGRLHAHTYSLIRESPCPVVSV